MTKVMVEALENFPYDFADRKKGDRFECDIEHARVFNAHGKTKAVEQRDEALPEKTDLPGNKPLPQHAPLETASVKAEGDTENSAEARRRRRDYKRRDMRADE